MFCATWKLISAGRSPRPSARENPWMAESGSTSPFSGRTAWARSLETPLRQFLRTETGSAAVLLGAAVMALAWVNIDSSSYAALWGTQLSVRLGGAGMAQDLRGWV